MLRELDCHGAPRDLGLDQGRAFRSELRADFLSQPTWSRWRQRLGARTAASARLARDLRRHYPQQSEMIEGMVSGTGVPYAWFADRLARELSDFSGRSIACAAAFAAHATLTTNGPLVVRTFATLPLVRRVRPEGGFASVDLAFPWLTSSLAGINEAGLVVASAALPSAEGADACAVPAPLLVQDCLARFDRVGGAVDWCSGRPAGGRSVILMADATGSVAGLEVDGASRRELPPRDGLLVAGAADQATDALLRAAPFDPARIAEIFTGYVVAIDPVGCRLGLREPSGRAITWFEAAPPG